MAVPVTGNVCVGVRRGARAAVWLQYTFCLWWWLPADWTGTVTFPASLPDVTLKTKPDMGATALFLAEEPRFSSMEKATLGLACEEQVERVEKFLPCSLDIQGLGTGIRKPWGHTCRTYVDFGKCPGQDFRRWLDLKVGFVESCSAGFDERGTVFLDAAF